MHTVITNVTVFCALQVDGSIRAIVVVRLAKVFCSSVVLSASAEMFKGEHEGHSDGPDCPDGVLEVVGGGRFAVTARFKIVLAL